MTSLGQKKTAIVTGGAGPGIGHGISEVLASQEWAVVIADRNEDEGNELVHKIRESGGDAVLVVGDVTSPQAPETTVQVALAEFGRLDALVNNVGMGLTKLVGETSDEEFWTLFNVDFMASFRFARAALPAILETHGSILNIGSVHAQLHAPKYALYSATKAALDAFTKGLAVDYGRQGLRANIIHPGLIESPQNEALLANICDDPRAWIDSFSKKCQAIPRLATAGEVGQLIAFLLSDGARSITAQSIAIDGGTTALLWNNEN